MSFECTVISPSHVRAVPRQTATTFSFSLQMLQWLSRECSLFNLTFTVNAKLTFELLFGCFSQWMLCRFVLRGWIRDLGLQIGLSVSVVPNNSNNPWCLCRYDSNRRPWSQFVSQQLFTGQGNTAMLAQHEFQLTLQVIPLS